MVNIHRKTFWAMTFVGLLLFAPFAAHAQDALSANAGADRSTTVGTQLTFSGAGSSGDITSYYWTFGDGTSANGVSVQKSYSSTGVYTVTLTVTDTNLDTAQDTAQLTVTQDSVRPSITHTNVTSGTPGQAISINAAFTDNVGVQGGTVFYRNASMNSFQSTSMTQTDGTNNWSANIPSSVVAGTYVRYYIRATDTASNNVGYPGGVLSDSTLAVNVSLADTSSPRIVHTQVTNATAGNARTITATVTDTGTGMNTTTLYYKRATASSYTSAAMTRAGNTFTGTIPAETVTTSHVHYYIQARDNASTPNTARAPTTAPSTGYGICVSNTVLRDTITVTEPSSVTSGSATSLSMSVSASSAKTLTNVTTWVRIGATWTKLDDRLPASGQKVLNQFTVAVPASAVTDDGLRYYVRANGTNNQDAAAAGFYGCTAGPRIVSAAVPSDSGSGSGGGGGGGGGPSAPSSRVSATSSTRNGVTTARAQVTVDAGKTVAVDLSKTNSPLRELHLQFPDAQQDAAVEVQIETGPPGGQDLPTGWASRLWLRITPPAGTTPLGSLTFTLPRGEFDVRDPGQVVLMHFGDAWEALPTTLADPTADPLVYTAVIGSFSPFAVAYDDEAPLVVPGTPVPDATASARPLIAGLLSDNRGIDRERTRMLLGETEVAASVYADRIEFRPEADLAAGPHTVTVEVWDESGLSATETWSFTADPRVQSEDPDDDAPGGDQKKDTPGPTALLVVAAVAGLLLVGRRGGRRD